MRIQLGPQAQILRDKGAWYAGGYATISPTRGQIYDRNGNLLAGNETVYEVGVSLDSVVNERGMAIVVSAALGWDSMELYNLIHKPEGDDRVYVRLADFVDAETIELLDLFANQYLRDNPDEGDPLRGLDLLPHLQRSYPEDDLAANLLGFVNWEGQGFFGIEQRYNDLLAGEAERVWLPNNPNDVQELVDVPPGASLVLTIDRQVQMVVEDVLDEAMEKNRSQTGAIVVMDPKTGEILAMAGSPRVDLNEYWRFTDVISGTQPFNHIVSEDYEPGSVFKILTMAAGIDAEIITPDSIFEDTGIYQVGGADIYNWNRSGWGPQTMIGCLRHSLNTCHADIAVKLGAQTFYDYMMRFGIGRSTGIDLSDEAPGRLKLPGDDDWHDSDLATNSFGQGLAVTPVQMLMSMSALANDGQMVAPHLLRSMVYNGNQYDIQPQIVGMPVSPETATTVTEMLAISMEDEASVAMIPGYRFAGKTGTAEIPTAIGYTSRETNTSFVGWGPAEDPQVMVYVWFEKPETSIWGSEVAAPVFREVVQKLVILLDIPPGTVTVGGR